MLLLPFATTLDAAEMQRLSVNHQHGEFIVDAQMHLKAPAAAVFRLLSDYDHWARLSKSVVSSQRIASTHPALHYVRSTTRACVLFYCDEISQVQEITEKPGSEILAVTLPKQSDLQQGVVHWHIEADGEWTGVTLSAQLTPDFWIPPFIGPWSIKASLRAQILETANNLERLAGSIAVGEQP